MLQRHSAADFERLVHRRGIFRLNSDDAYLRIEVLHVHGDSCDQPATAYRNEDGVHVAAGLAKDLDSNGSLACNDVGVIEGVNEDHISLPGNHQGAFESGVVIISMQHDLRTQVHHRLNLDGGRGLRHHHGRRDSPVFGRKRHSLGMVARGGADHAAPRRCFG